MWSGVIRWGLPPAYDGFVYNDDRKFTKEQLAELAGLDIEEAERILSFADQGSSTHSAWLTFMYPRLYVARELLQDDGVIFISIDDNEQSQLKILCDEVFGESNFVANFIWEKRTNRENRKVVSSRHDYVICYAKSKDSKERIIAQLPMNEKALSNYKNPDNDPNGL
ncbi:TPA: site-specific DNA-methyltransferase [Vibrio vulnificus]|nr:site-specific DNA-methyltransferase [Vibrio vulnificus]